MKTNRVQDSIPWLIISIPILVGSISYYLFGHVTWVNVELHSTIEAVDGLASIIIALFLLQEKDKDQSIRLYLLANGFIGMGVLNLLHGPMTLGRGFVLTKIMASLICSVWFLLVFLSTKLKKYESLFRKKIPLITVGGSVLLGICIVRYRDYFPIMIKNNNFTVTAVALSLLAGLFFLASAWRLLHDSCGVSEDDKLVFVPLALLFGLSELAFPFSVPWCSLWWMWHFLNLIACTLAVWWIIKNHYELVSILNETIAQREASQRHAALLSDLLEHSSQPFGLGYPEERLGICNSAFPQLLGYSMEEFMMLNWAKDLTPPEWQEHEKLMLEELRRTGQPVRYEKEYFRQNGTRVPVEMFVHLCQDAMGQPQYYYAFVTDITERKQAEEALKDTKAVLQAALDQSQAGIAIADAPDGKLRYVNRAGLLILGESEAETAVDIDFSKYPKTWQLFDFNGSRLKDDEVPLARAIRYGETWTREFIIRRADGQDRIVWANGAPILDDTGRIKAGIVVFLDITEHKRAEKEIRLNESRLESLLKISQYKASSVPDLLDFALDEAISLTESKIGYIYYYDEERKEFTLNCWSKEVMKECSITNPQTIYQLDKTGIWGEAVRQRKPIIVNEFQAPNPFKKGYPEGHVSLQRFLTLPISVDEKIVAVVGVANKDTNYNQGDVRQLTLLMESVWMITERKRSEEALRESEARFRSFFDLPLIGMAVTTPEKIFVEVNDELCNIFGYHKNELVQRTWADLTHPDDLQANTDQFEQVLAGKTDGLSLTKRFIRKDGLVIHADVTTRCVRSFDGAVRYFVTLVKDITNSMQAEMLLRRNEKRLREAQQL
ncbi:MAG: PAS domain S-box protein, partial [Deltaproteobacteria bacterium]|nr:PAS domain S-box protein [Deltaproteobacteria bacterium]